MPDWWSSLIQHATENSVCRILLCRKLLRSLITTTRLVSVRQSFPSSRILRSAVEALWTNSKNKTLLHCWNHFIKYWALWAFEGLSFVRLTDWLPYLLYYLQLNTSNNVIVLGIGWRSCWTEACISILISCYSCWKMIVHVTGMLTASLLANEGEGASRLCKVSFRTEL